MPKVVNYIAHFISVFLHTGACFPLSPPPFSLPFGQMVHISHRLYFLLCLLYLKGILCTSQVHQVSLAMCVIVTGWADAQHVADDRHSNVERLLKITVTATVELIQDNRYTEDYCIKFTKFCFLSFFSDDTVQDLNRPLGKCLNESVDCDPFNCYWDMILLYRGDNQNGKSRVCFPFPSGNPPELTDMVGGDTG